MFNRVKGAFVDTAALLLTRVGTLQNAGWNALSDLGIALLDLDDLERYTLASYGVRSAYTADAAFQEQGLFPWENRLVDEFFPRPPAHILVPACGGGREIVPLLRRGYSVTAFDPVEKFVRVAAERTAGFGDQARVLRLSFDDLLKGPVQPPGGPFDAVLVGWGALAHVLRPQDAQNLLRRLREASSGGPIVVSFFSPNRAAVAAGSRRARFRAVLSRLTGSDFSDPGLSFQPLAGAMRYYDRAQLEMMSRSAGLAVELYEEEGGAVRALLMPA
jgi:2-polyprenyl-3-methyl-5-hydroxy-6-metoxy-1,4-benzoquinol methylase